MTQAQEPAAIPTQIDVRIHTLRTDGAVLANASVSLNGCFAVRGVKVMESGKGLFVSMPSYKTAEGTYKDLCFPCTKEFKQQFDQAVLEAYQQELAQLHQRRRQQTTEQSGPRMSM